MPRLIIEGEPGEVYENGTGKVLFQLIVSWHNSCGLCISYDHKVGDYWPIPYHRGCNCKQIPILPGKSAQPYVDYRAKILTVSRDQQASIMGRSNLAMVESGLVDWSDVVTPSRVRSLREVASRKRLTVDQMVGSGVNRGRAEEAWNAVHTATHTASEARRQEQVKALLNKGYTRQQVLDAAGNAIGSRIGIVEGPSGASVVPYTPKPTPRPVPVVPAKVAALKPAKPKPVPVPEPATPEAKPGEPPHVAEWRRIVSEATPKAVAARDAARAELARADKALADATKAYKDAAAQFADGSTLRELMNRQDAARAPVGDARNAVDRAEHRASRLESWEDDRKKIPNLVPPVPMAARIKLYSEGDRKVEAIRGLGDEAAGHFRMAESGREELRKKWTELDVYVRQREFLKLPKKQQAAFDEAKAELAKLQAELVATKASAENIGARVREGLSKLLRVDRPAEILVEVQVGSMTPENLAKVRQAEEFFRGKFAAGDTPTIRIAGRDIPASQEQRDYQNGDTIHLSHRTRTEVVVHEAGHALDDLATLGGSRAGQTTREFLDHRVGDEKPRPMTEVAPSANFKAGEMGRKDRFDEVFDERQAYYTGKSYAGRTSSEILSMGLQLLYSDPVRFAEKDPEYLKFVLGMLDGSLR